VSTDGAASVAGQKSDFVPRIREIDPKISWKHCITNKQNLARIMTLDLHETLNISVKVLKFNQVSCIELPPFQENVRENEIHTH
jgi:hypothetical protein